jgi:integrase
MPAMIDSNAASSIAHVFDALGQSRFSPRSSWWIALVCIECVFDSSNHHALNVGAVSTYENEDGDVVLEFSLEGGWTDRRHLQPLSIKCLSRNQGHFFSKNDLKTVDFEVSKVFGFGEGQHHQKLIEVAKSFWSTRLAGVLLGHCLGSDRFQLLNRQTMWRRSTRAVSQIPKEEEVKVDFLGWKQATKSLVVANFVVSQMVDIARREGARHAARQRMVECIDKNFPAALVEGQMQALALLSLKEVIQTGGMRGRLLAPSSIITYLGTTFVLWVRALIDLGMESEPVAYISSYSSILSAQPSSRQGQVKALIDILHTRIVLRGAPLLRSPRSMQRQSIPRAQFLWPHEIELALEYVASASGDPRVAAQARLVIVLGLAIPLRTSEYFQIRLVDVCPNGIASLVVFPRRMDGKHKSPHNRLHADIHDVQLCEALLMHKVKRCAEEALPSENSSPNLFFFGAPGYSDSPCAVTETIDLVNRALRWATGDPQASVYSLRHTVISNRALLCMTSEPDTDALVWEAMSKDCGHGNPDSTSGYVHQIEVPLKHNIARYLPVEVSQDDENVIAVASLNSLFPMQERSIVEAVPEHALKAPQGLTIGQFVELLGDLATGIEIPVAVAKFKLKEHALSQIFHAAKQRWAGPASRLLTERDVLVALLEMGPIARHSQQPKYDKFRIYVQKIGVDMNAARALAMALENCTKGNEISLAKGYWSDSLFQSLVSAGYGKGEIVVFAEVRDELSDVYIPHGTWRAQKSRRGRARVRLGLIDRQTSTPKAASGAAYSAAGLSWLGVALSLWLAVRGEM